MRQRRKVNKEWLEKFEEIKLQTARYGDALQRIDTVEMYDGVDDKPADCLVVCDLLEHMADVDAELVKINNLARKAILVIVRTDVRPENEWRKLLDRRLNVLQSYAEADHVTFSCNAGMKVYDPGRKLTGVLTEDVRWEQIQASIARFDKRLVAAPAHGRRAIAAGYGPSLQDNWQQLEHERVNEDALLVTCSGSHDFLIDRGIIPDYHIDCDPRPRTNINKPNKSVRYLMASCCAPMVFDRLEGQDVALWHVADSHHIRTLVDEMGEPNETMISGPGNVGLCSIVILYTMGYRKFSVYGLDCSLADGQQWAGKHVDDKPPELTEAQCGDRIFISTPALVHYSGLFFDVIHRLPDAKFRVYGDGLLQEMCRLYWSLTQLEEVA